MDWQTVVWISLLFFVIATLYSSVGFGGGSSYLAILALYLADQHIIRSHALVCNIAVVGIGTFMAYRHGHLRLKQVVLYTALSVPMSYLGATLALSDRIFFLALAIALMLSALGLAAQVWWLQHRVYVSDLSKLKPLLLGGGVGFLSGMVGIGGGIFLSPLCHLLRLAQPREIASLAGFFILVNSLAGLAGLAATHRFALEPGLLFAVLAPVVLGGMLGARLNNRVLLPGQIRLLTAALVFFVGIRLLLKYL